MKHMFAGNVWSAPQNQAVQGMGFRPGAVQVKIVSNQPGNFQLGASQQAKSLPFRPAGTPPPSAHMEGECADGSCEMPKPSQIQGNRIPMGKKTDCPVCRSFGGGKGTF